MSGQQVRYQGGPLDGEAALGRATFLRYPDGSTLRYRLNGCHISFRDASDRFMYAPYAGYYQLGDGLYVWNPGREVTP